jgi:hypothetical protein
VDGWDSLAHVRLLLAIGRKCQDSAQWSAPRLS